MEIIKECSNNNYLNQTQSKAEFNDSPQTEFLKKSKVTDYFDLIYNYPPKIKIKWDNVDQLSEDFFVDFNRHSFEPSLSNVDFTEDFVFTKASDEAVSNDYSISKYIDGFLNKVSSSNFFLKKTKKIQSTLVNVPVFVILNGQGEIVLSKPGNILGSKTFSTYINGKLYDFCGAFDSIVEKKSEFGLFFMHYGDADKYLKEVARSDFEGTQTVGLSINCISLDSAYRITREHHPGIDFRFVPNFNEVKELLISNVGKSNLIVENEQQQLRFCRRKFNIFPYLNKLGGYLPTGSSFLQRNEYFKGVPIYIVQLTDRPRNWGAEQYFKIVNKLDSTCNQVLQLINYSTGFGHRQIMQGSVKDIRNSEKVSNFIFFEKEQAIEFSRNNGRKVARYSGSYISSLGSIIRKPKILVYNFEDFLEDWEDHVLGNLDNDKNTTENIFKCGSTNFVPPKNNLELNGEFSKKTLNQFLDVKFRILKRTIGVFFSV